MSGWPQRLSPGRAVAEPCADVAFQLLQPPHEHGLVSADTRPEPGTPAALRLQASLSTWSGVFANLPEKMPVGSPGSPPTKRYPPTKRAHCQQRSC